MRRSPERFASAEPSIEELSDAAELVGARLAKLRFEDGEYLVLSYDVTTVPPLGVLTDAEFSVVKLVLAGLSNREIAAVRGASVRTIANQLAAVYRKLRVSSRIELALALSSKDEPTGARGVRCTQASSMSWK